VIARFRRRMEKICPIIFLRRSIFKTQATFGDGCSMG
jgi:hypothetical protein